ncbi:NAD(P)/FAD-dependent oxidoreductase [Bacillus marinisedimentorum]|uniref:NAD(P)/FAD-dependent oxidoreductase n=1 Tax=Bacillus marinisedimentorum TaxID=1821260 RepID=UPI0008732315|nr:NAD(P)/FAD-dependent oxidoreductase [Bacillus marinisedimentorum]
MHDVLIIGGGISGLSAAVYTAYGKLDTVVLDTETSQIKRVGTLRNYPGVLETSGEQLLENMRKQAESFGAEVQVNEVKNIEPQEGGFSVETETGTMSAKYVIVATNIKTDLLENLGLSLIVNEKVPSGKIKQVEGVGFDGVTSRENLYIAGLLTGLSSQSVIAAGQGAQLGVDIVTRETGKMFIWHDV